MRNFILAGVILVSGCTAAQLEAVGVSPDTAAKIVTVTTQAVTAGQLFCTAAGKLYQAGVVKVTDASAASVAAACNALVVGSQIIAGTPLPVAPGVPVTVATVPGPVAAAVDASRQP